MRFPNVKIRRGFTLNNLLFDFCLGWSWQRCLTRFWSFFLGAIPSQVQGSLAGLIDALYGLMSVVNENAIMQSGPIIVSTAINHPRCLVFSAILCIARNASLSSTTSWAKSLGKVTANSFSSPWSIRSSHVSASQRTSAPLTSLLFNSSRACPRPTEVIRSSSKLS